MEKEKQILSEKAEKTTEIIEKTTSTKNQIFKRYLWVFIILTVLVIAGITVALSKNPGKISSQSQNYTNQTESNQFKGRWLQTENGWKAQGDVPSCPEPLELSSITDLSLATSVLYPGQMRSVGYENTAGFRFDKTINDKVSVSAPLDGEVIQAARFTVGGELQFVFDILSPCGIMTRFDHLLTLTPKFQKIADNLPPPKENDSRSTSVSPPIKVLRGEVIATGVGIRKNNNTFISWTMFDFRQKNKASDNPTWAKNHPLMDHYAICPFPYMPQKEQEIIKKLPAADSMSGDKSDFCE